MIVGILFIVSFLGGNPCDSNPCQNNGVCRPIEDNKYYCQCAEKYYGVNCECKSNIHPRKRFHGRKRFTVVNFYFFSNGRQFQQFNPILLGRECSVDERFLTVISILSLPT